MVSYKELIDNNPTNKYKQHYVFTKSGMEIIEYYPKMKSTSSSVTFWLNKLRVRDIKIDIYGYFSTDELESELIGFYSFYIKERYYFI